MRFVYAGCDRLYTPKVAVVIASGKLTFASPYRKRPTGACEATADLRCGIPRVINAMLHDFQQAYPMRYAIGIGPRQFLLRTSIDAILKHKLYS